MCKQNKSNNRNFVNLFSYFVVTCTFCFSVMLLLLLLMFLIVYVFVYTFLYLVELFNYSFVRFLGWRIGPSIKLIYLVKVEDYSCYVEEINILSTLPENAHFLRSCCNCYYCFSLNVISNINWLVNWSLYSDCKLSIMACNLHCSCYNLSR